MNYRRIDCALLFSCYYANHHDVHYCDTDDHADSDNLRRNHTCCGANGQAGSDGDADPYTDHAAA